MRRSTNAVGTDLIAVETNSVGSAGQKFLTTMTLSNFLNSLIGLPNFPAGGSGSGETNLNAAAGATNSTRIELPYDKIGRTNRLKTVSSGYGAAATNESTNVTFSVDAAVIPSHTQLGTASNTVWNLTGIHTNISQMSSNEIVVHPTADVLINGQLLTNAVKIAGAIGGGTRKMQVRLLPGFYMTPTNTLPSVMTAVENVSTYWETGAEWGSGTSGGESAFMWDFTAGKRTNCHIFGNGRFWLTNDGASCIIIENSSRMHVEALSFYATDTAGASTANPFTWDSTAVEFTFDIKDYIDAPVYDGIYGDVTAGQKIRGRIQEVRCKGDIYEFVGDSPAWGLIDLDIGIGRQNVVSGQDSFLQIGGRTRVRIGQIFVTSLVSRITSGSATTNGILEGAVIQMPANGTVSPVSFLPPATGNSGYTLRNVVVYGPTNVDMCNITNTVTNPLTLENCTFYNGWASTNWIRGSTPSFVRIIGSLALHPYRPVGNNITMDGHVKSVPNYGAPAAGQLLWWHDSTTPTNRGAHFTGMTNTGTYRNIGDLTITGIGTFPTLDVTGDFTANTVTSGAGGFGDVSVINVIPGRLAMFNPDNTLTNVEESSDFLLPGSYDNSLSISTNLIHARTEDQTPATNDMLHSLDVSTASRKKVALGNLPLSYTAQVASSNNVRVVAGTGGITVTGSGSGGVQTWTVNDDDAGGGSVTNFAVTTHNYSAHGSTLTTNTSSLMTTNLGTNASVTFDLLGPAVGHYGISGNSTIFVTNVVGFTNNPGGRYVELVVRQFGVAGTLTISPVGPHPINFEEGLFIAQNATNTITIKWDGQQLRGSRTHVDVTGSGAYVRSNTPTITTPNLTAPVVTNGMFLTSTNIKPYSVAPVNTNQMDLSGTNINGFSSNSTTTNGVNLTGTNVNTALIGSTTFLPGSGSATVVIPAAASVLVTNLVGLTHKSSASVIEFNHNTGQKFTVTNRVTAATTCVLTNGADGQQMSGVMLGEVSGGTSRVITFVPQLGHLMANLNAFGSALATSYSETLTNGNAMEWNTEIRRSNGTNVMGIVTRQYAF